MSIKGGCCENCIWYDKCGTSEACTYFSPVSDDILNKYRVEEGRIAFRQAWEEYTREYNED